jgi:hypothetical protein
LVIFAVASIVGLILSRFALGVFLAGVVVGVVTFAIWVSSRFLRSELFSLLVWLFPLISYGLTLDLDKVSSESTLHLVPFFVEFTAAAFLSATILQAMFDDRLETLKPMP